jgi:prepilin-type N-terminal cleavage/methylation domain-containing protein
MKTESRQSGLTMTEMVLVVAIIALLTSLGLPAVRMLIRSFESSSGATSMISAALASARAIAAREQRYAGIRFQRDSAGEQYMIFIVHDFDNTGLNSGFRAVEGIKPVKLPRTSGVMDMMVRTNHGINSTDATDTLDEPLQAQYLDDSNPLNISTDGKNRYVRDTVSFSVIFSPAGKLVIRAVRIRNRDGVYRPDNTVTNKVSMDDVFNSPVNIAAGVGRFVQDDYAELGLGAEPSRNRFVVYDRTEFDKLNALGKYDYLNRLEPVYINPYTGTMIAPD